jgi:cell division transport system ATP-binding protein
MIIFENITKKFPLGNVALDNISFSIEDNEFVFLVGPSGAGKTTIIKLILKEIEPTSGSILVDDLDITNKNFSKILTLRRNLGVIFQDFKIIYEKNVFENIALSLLVLEKYSSSKIKEKVRESLTIVGLKDKEKVFPIQLSAGELQRVTIARAIAGERKIILADEPTGNLDPKTTWEIMKIFKKIEKEKTIIFATHNADIVNSFQRRVLVLKNGKIVKDLRKGKYEF